MGEDSYQQHQSFDSSASEASDLEPTSIEAIEKEVTDNNSSFKLFFQFLSLSTERTVKALNKKSKLDNVAIFVDYDNVYWTLMNNYSHDPNHEDPEKNLFLKLWKKYGQENVRTFRAYADFEKVRTELTSLQKKRIQIRHVYSNGKDGDHRKNSSDIELCIDAIEHTYKDPNVTCYVFVTADSDMIPIISRMMYKNKRVELYYLSNAVPKHVDITSYVQRSEDLLDFLNVEIKKYEVHEYVLKALLFVSEWHKKYHETDMFLGASWLRTQFSKNFMITAAVASELIEKLKLEDYIIDDKKKLSNGEVKNTLNLTGKGQVVVEKHEAMIATSLENK
ncbi:NYN domain-containing protein [Paenibacillus ehimensis]|uniref:NYN domain-containing protein n=1 Tax=Paenibacillus ehimensis TaxID=79264 RepID=UPI002DB7450A|nr:NYN domain-containing protein [Paenibacillus ehimensis]MEC0211337.1 NYN domain-containing protein [Paenibacillus ehimensis]